MDQWPEQGPAISYRTKGLGSGMASLAIHAGLLYTIGNIEGKTNLICRNAGDGAEVGRPRLPMTRERPMGHRRSIQRPVWSMP